jgi:hypothetical protein
MRSVLRVIGWILLLVAAGLLVAELFGYLRYDDEHLSTIGELWLALHPASLQGFHALVRSSVWPGLWEDIIRPVIVAVPAPALPGVLGLVFLAVAYVGRRDEPGTPRRARRRRGRNSLLG